MLFDSKASRAAAVAAFVLDAISRNEAAAVIATGDHWEAIVRAAGPGASAISRGLAQGTIAFRDAEVLLFEIWSGSVPNRRRFESAVRDLLQDLPRGPVHVYGELVDLLAARGEFNAAVRLEEFWNDLIGRDNINLLCGYDATTFAPDRATSRLRAVCGCHTHTHMASDDVLGRWLLTQANVPFETATHGLETADR